MKDRVKELRRVKAGDLVPNPKNWRTHGTTQRSALQGLLNEVGFADAVLARELPDGRLMLIDGHLRQEEANPDDKLPVLVLDVTEEEADKILLTHDPLAAMAETNMDALRAMLLAVKTEDRGLGAMLLELSGQDLEDVMKPPKTGPKEMELQPYEHYDYVLVLARNTIDFKNLCDKLGLESVKSSLVGKGKIGLGRCVSADKLLGLMK